jgi:hypothetical protein
VKNWASLDVCSKFTGVSFGTVPSASWLPCGGSAC